MAVTTRDKRLPQLKLTLDVPSCAFRYPAVEPLAAPPPPSTSAPATHGELRLSDFDRLAVLGRGSGGTVYLVSHRRSSARYALKVLHRGDAGDPAAAEADAARRVANSPHVVRCHAALPTACGGVALLLELVDGGSLESLAAGHGPLPEAAVAEVAAQALSGLAHLRARRVVHRDVKPANLLVTRSGRVKLTDFGIAALVPRAAAGGDHRAAGGEGTAAYMSPERFDAERLRGERVDPFAADVWSLGVTVLELAMGRYPLLPAAQRPTWAALMCAICFAEPPALPDGLASPELRTFVAACLRKDHRKRATVAELLAHPFVAGRDVAASKRALREVIELRCS
ncbi:hypothetical protein ACP4OV_001758 [Aristida adscensionis]